MLWYLILVRQGRYTYTHWDKSIQKIMMRPEKWTWAIKYMLNGTWHAGINESENNTMCPIYIMCLGKNEQGLNIITFDYMRYNGPSLKKWAGGRIEQPKKPWWIGKGLYKIEWIIWRRRACYECCKRKEQNPLNLHNYIWDCSIIWSHPGMWGSTWRTTASWGLEHLTRTWESLVQSVASLDHQVY